MIKYRLQYYFLRPHLTLIRLLPPAAAHFLARRLADFVYLIAGKRRAVGMENLEKAFGNSLSRKEKKKILRASFQNTAMSITDLFIIKNIRKRAREYFQIEGLENYKKALAGGRGVVLVTSHLGSWEFLAFLFYLTNTRCSVVVKEIRNLYFNHEVNEARKETGLNPIPKKNSIRGVLAELKKGRTAAILIDQWAGGEGIWQEFFGEMTSTTSIPARLALRTDCALLPAFCLRTKDRKYKIVVHKPIFKDGLEENSEAAITRHLNGILEEMILAHPQQWSWGHRRWKPKPDSLREAE